MGDKTRLIVENLSSSSLVYGCGSIDMAVCLKQRSGRSHVGVVCLSTYRSICLANEREYCIDSMFIRLQAHNYSPVTGIGRGKGIQMMRSARVRDENLLRLYFSIDWTLVRLVHSILQKFTDPNRHYTEQSLKRKKCRLLESPVSTTTSTNLQSSASACDAFSISLLELFYAAPSRSCSLRRLSLLEIDTRNDGQLVLTVSTSPAIVLD